MASYKRFVSTGREKEHSFQSIMNGILYITKSGCQRHMLPGEYASWQKVYYYFRHWQLNGLLEELYDYLVEKERLQKGKNPVPSVDTLELVLAIVVHSATPHDSTAALNVLKVLKNKYLVGLVKIFADSGYREELIETVRSKFGWILEIIQGNETGKFKILPKRWIVERTFAWIYFQRKTSKDYEGFTETSVAIVHFL